MTTTLDPRWGTRSPMHEPALLAGFQPRATDVLITTAPKCGTTWMQQILHQIRTGGDESFAVIADVVPWLELPDRSGDVPAQLERYAAMPNPRVFKTHCTAPQTPGIDVVRLVMTSRDPRDAAVSMFHHKRDLTDEARARSGESGPATLEEHVAQWISFGSWYRNVLSWWPERHRQNLLWLRYEDLIADLPTGVDRIASFLEWPLTAEQRERVVRQSSFEWMRENRDRFNRQRADSAPAFKPNGFIRKGEVGGRTELGPVQAEAILARAREVLEPECRAFFGIG